MLCLACPNAREIHPQGETLRVQQLAGAEIRHRSRLVIRRRAWARNALCSLTARLVCAMFATWCISLLLIHANWSMCCPHHAYSDTRPKGPWHTYTRCHDSFTLCHTSLSANDIVGDFWRRCCLLPFNGVNMHTATSCTTTQGRWALSVVLHTLLDNSSLFYHFVHL